MSLRRFVNLLMENGEKGVYSLRRLNLSRHPLFYSSTEVSAVQDLPALGEEGYVYYPFKGYGESSKQAFEVESIRLPSPTVSLLPTPSSTDKMCKFDCFSVSESKIICTDQAARTFLYDLDEHCVTSMPSLHAPKYSPFSVSVAIQGEKGEGESSSSSSRRLYVMEEVLLPERGTGSSYQFEAFDHRKPGPEYLVKAWHCDPLPPPPFVRDPRYVPSPVSSYAVVGNFICISTKGIGTYCFDTVSCSWSHAGDWMLPFCGKGEYVPELKLWFGVSAKNNYAPCASDLSPVVRAEPPKPGCIWEDLNLPEDWRPCRMSDLVNLGSGRFCIIRFFQPSGNRDYMKDQIDQTIAVFSGVEVLPDDNKAAGNGKGKGKQNAKGLRMIKHKSRKCTFIEQINNVESVL